MRDIYVYTQFILRFRFMLTMQNYIRITGVDYDRRRPENPLRQSCEKIDVQGAFRSLKRPGLRRGKRDVAMGGGWRGKFQTSASGVRPAFGLPTSVSIVCRSRANFPGSRRFRPFKLWAPDKQILDMRPRIQLHY